MKKSRTPLAVLIALLFTLSLSPCAYAQITPLGDTYTSSTDPTTNYGAQKTLNVDAAKEITYIQFNLASIPNGASISQATLKLYVNTVPTAGSFEVYAVNGTWAESTLTYSLAPALGSVIDSNVPITTADKNQYILIPMTSTVQGWLNTPSTNNGIALVAVGTFDATFDSKETATTSHPAELDIVFAGDGTITGVTTASGSGLTGGGTSGTLNLSLTNACAANQVLQWSGSAWACASVGTGTITGVTAGTDLTRRRASGNVTLNVNTTALNSVYAQLASANTFTGNQTVNGNLSATGLVTGSSFQIGSNLFDYGSYANQNAFLGFAGNSTMTGTQNTAAGVLALSSNTTGGVNTAIGYNALLSNTAGNSNVAVGWAANLGTTTGTGNVAVGASSLPFNTIGSSNTAIGEAAGQTPGGVSLTGARNTALGADTLFGTGTLSNATAVGANAEVTESNAMVLGSGVMVGIGTTAPAFSLDVHGTGNFTGAVAFGSPITFASGQTFPGTGTITGVTAGTDLTGGGTSGTITLNLNTAATNALYAQLATANTFTGNQTVNGTLSATGTVTGSSYQIGSNLFAFGNYGNGNAFLGYAGNTGTGSGNVGVGPLALASNNGGINNAATGALALNNNADGCCNTGNGYSALLKNTNGSGNTALGYQSGETNDSSNITGFNNTIVGANAGIATGTLSNATAIGAYAEASASNALVLGSINGVNTATSSVSVGIGTTAPASTLDVRDNGSGGSTFSSITARVTNAVYGANSSTSGSGANGGYFVTASPQGSGIVAVNTGSGSTDYAAYFEGNVEITGTLSKGSGSFKIDHPLDPANKYLYHSFVESPDMMNIYNGVAALDTKGSVWITLPDYFEALNQDFRYQLTSIGRPQPSLYVAKEISGNRFKISGGKAGGKVSWQVTGIRHDAYADAHRIQVEEEKPPQEQGRYLHPELFGAPTEQAIGYHAPPVAAQAAGARVSSLKTPTPPTK